MSIFSELQRIVDFAYNNERSTWYRDLCQRHGIQNCPDIKSLDDLQTLPLMDRKTVNQYSPADRLSAPSGDIDDIRSTSGTSGQDPLFYYRSAKYRLLPRLLVGAGARRKLYLWSSQQVITHVENDRLEGLQTIICDPQQMPDHVPLISKLKIDTLAGTPSLLLMLGRLLESTEDRFQIRFLELTGEPARGQTLKELKHIFPLSQNFFHYALGEMGQEIGYKTPTCTDPRLGYFHLNPTGVYAENLNGELVLTQLNVPTALPLIRYRTGDQISWLGEDSCACGHKGVSFHLAGRANVDFIRIAGVELRHEEIARLVATAPDKFEDYVAVEVYERISAGRQSVTIEIKTVPKAPVEKTPEKLSSTLSHHIAKHLRLSATTTLNDMIKAGYFAQPKVTLLPETPITSKSPGIKFIE